MKQKILIETGMLLLAIVIISGCNKNALPQSQWTGRYELEKILWAGEYVDLNGDGDSYPTLLNEYKKMLGYNYAKNFAEAVSPAPEYAGDVDGLVTMSLPLPFYVKNDDGTYSVSKVSYIDFSFPIYQWDDSWSGIIQPRINDKNDPFLSGIQQVSMFKGKNEDDLRANVYCNLYRLDGTDPNTNNLQFFFRKAK